jgi:non-homologous end joining protein Ku
MAERGQRTTLLLGGVEAEVSLLKLSGKPRDAQYETRRKSDPGAVAEAEPEAERPRVDALSGVREAAHEHAASLAEVLPPAPRAPEVMRGAVGPDGEFVDLTDQLAEIDERTVLDGMEVVATVDQAEVPSVRVRDAHYVAPAGEGAPKVLAILWTALRDRRSAALVRWTKRTNQALGAIVARGRGKSAHLVLLELEWQANMRPAAGRADLSAAVAATSEREQNAARALVAALRQPPGIFTALVDERAQQRAELLEAVRSGVDWEPEEAEVVEHPSLRDVLATSAA